MRLSPTLLRSALVGLVATAADVGCLFVLVQGLGWTAVQANVPALTLGVTLQFFGNKILAFRDRSRDYLRQGSLFVLVEAGTFVLNAIAFHLLVTLTPVPYALARGIGTLVVYLVFSYPLWKRIFASPAVRARGDVRQDPVEPELRESRVA
jgi:putative flippase GtrA